MGETEQSNDLEDRSTNAASHPEEEESYYTKEDDDIVFGSFVGIESFCTRCQDAFPSKSLSHKHL